VNVRGHILHTPRTAEWLQSIGHSMSTRTKLPFGAGPRLNLLGAKAAASSV
jgi:hypothetical protein